VDQTVQMSTQVCQFLCELGLTKSYIEGCEVRQRTTE